MQLDPDRSLFDQSSELPYDFDFEFPRERLRMVKVLGSGAFGEVWLAQAYQITLLNPRDKSEEANKQREKMRRAKKVEREMDKEIREGKSLDLTAVKKIKGTQNTLKTKLYGNLSSYYLH